MKNEKKNNRLGEINYNYYGNKMIIVEYIDANDITVQFNNGWVTHSDYRWFKKGGIKSPYDKTVYDKGYVGVGNYNIWINRKKTIEYAYWHGMLQRCYDDKYKDKYPTYIGCSVCEEWLNFQNFAEWTNKNYYKINNERMELDKDILCKGNKEYNSNNCVFVPQRINYLFTKSNANRGNYPIGVYFHTRINRFVAQCSIINPKNKKSQKFIGYYDTPEDAFYLGYKPFKESYIKEVAEQYKYKIPNKLYKALCNWKVEITD